MLAKCDIAISRETTVSIVPIRHHNNFQFKTNLVVVVENLKNKVKKAANGKGCYGAYRVAGITSDEASRR